ncbi:MAG: helix-turn-helix domain-containing protein [Pirellulaceae bacterium]|nr:helix-turn-helix domain-containing protein [Pirellulaceae bacterium]
MSKATSGAPPAPDDRRAGASEGRVKPGPATKASRPARGPEHPPPATLGRETLSVAQQRAATILEVLAGEQTVGEAARLLGISVMRYYLLERRALQGLTTACAPRPKGPPGPGPEQELPRLRRELERCRRDCLRQAALVRATQRAVGVRVAAAGPAKGKAPPKGKPEPTNGKLVERSPAEGDAPLGTGSGPPREGEPARTVTQEAEHGTQRQEAARHGSCGAAGGIGVGQAAADHHPPDAAR